MLHPPVGDTMQVDNTRQFDARRIGRTEETGNFLEHLDVAEFCIVKARCVYKIDRTAIPMFKCVDANMLCDYSRKPD
jgi:hypothetical protein